MNYRLLISIAILTFLASLITFIPGTAQAALTLNNFIGFETNGVNEALSSGGTPTLSTTTHSGDWSLQFDAAADEYDAAIITGASTDSDNDFIFGFAIRWSDKVPSSSNVTFASVRDDGALVPWQIQIQTDSDIRFVDANNTIIDADIADPFTANEWHIIEVRWQHSETGAFDAHIDGSSVISETGVDLSHGGTIGADDAFYRFEGAVGADFLVDDIYSFSGGTGTADFLGNPEIFRYQGCSGSPGCDNSATPDTGDNLDQGVWQDLGETPLSSDATEPAYTGAALDGEIYTDDTQSGNNFRHGPHDDTNIDGTSNIKGAKLFWVLRRGNGSGTVHSGHYGNDSGAATVTASLTLDNDFLNFFVIDGGPFGGGSGANPPDDTEHWKLGFGKDSGGRDIFAEEMWGFTLHVPDAPVGGVRRIFYVE